MYVNSHGFCYHGHIENGLLHVGKMYAHPTTLETCRMDETSSYQAVSLYSRPSYTVHNTTLFNIYHWRQEREPEGNCRFCAEVGGVQPCQGKNCPTQKVSWDKKLLQHFPHTTKNVCNHFVLGYFVVAIFRPTWPKQS